MCQVVQGFETTGRCLDENIVVQVLCSQQCSSELGVLFLLSSAGCHPCAQQLLAAVSLPTHGSLQEAVAPQVPPAVFSCLPSGL